MRVVGMLGLWLAVIVGTVASRAETISPASDLASDLASDFTGDFTGDFVEGGMVIGQTDPRAVITLDAIPVPVSGSGRFVLGFHRDSPPTMLLRIVLPNGKSHEKRLIIAEREYPIQAIDGLQKRHVTPDPAVIKRIKNDAAMVRGVRERFSPLEHFAEQWVWPATGTITGVYGSQRILNGKLAAPHYGIDIAVPEGTPVMAPASGIVSLVEDLYYSGLTIMIDHGMGISSTLLHLRDSLVEVGETVTGGQRIGLSGNSGRSTGPHLDWRVNWGNHARLDAALLVPGMPAAESPVR